MLNDFQLLWLMNSKLHIKTESGQEQSLKKGLMFGRYKIYVIEIHYPLKIVYYSDMSVFLFYIFNF